MANSRKQLEQVVEIITSDLTYLPSPQERRIKAAFWNRYTALDIPPCEVTDITLAVAQSLSPEPRLDKWWSIPGFAEWFRNAEEFRERVEFLTSLALDALTDILVSDDPRQASARVAAAKLMLEVGKKMPPKVAPEKFVDARIGEMDREQLQAYIARQTKALPPPK